MKIKRDNFQRIGTERALIFLRDIEVNELRNKVTDRSLINMPMFQLDVINEDGTVETLNVEFKDNGSGIGDNYFKFSLLLLPGN